MKLQNQVVSLELSKRLADLGFKQESLFYWFSGDGISGHVQYESEAPEAFAGLVCSAFTVAELFSFINFDTEWMLLSIDPVSNKWVVTLKNEVFKGDKLADCLAELIIKTQHEE